MNTRSSILTAAAQLLAQSSTGDVSTRAVCDAAGVTQPVLYRLFGDKDGLLAAVVDTVWEDYLGTKRSAEKSADPLDDLRRGWDNHTAFALANPHAYRLLFGSSMTSRPEAAAEAMGLLRGVLVRLAEQGRLRLEPDQAAQIVMAANTGAALGLILHPELFPDPGVSTRTRDATVRAILTDAGATETDAAATAATTLRARLAQADTFTPGEAALLGEWLDRIQTPRRPG